MLGNGIVQMRLSHQVTITGTIHKTCPVVHWLRADLADCFDVGELGGWQSRLSSLVVHIIVFISFRKDNIWLLDSFNLLLLLTLIHLLLLN